VSLDDDARVVEIRSRLGRAITRICPAWLNDYREDILQAAMVRLLSVGQPERIAALPSSYLWKVAYSAMIDEIRRLRRVRATSLDLELNDPPTNDPGADPERVQAGQRLGEGIRGCLATLAEARRQAVTLHLVGHSGPEISRLLRWDLKRVENALYRGLADLRACLTSKGLAP